MEPQQPEILERILGPLGGYIWLFLIATWGGVSNYISRLKRDKTPFSFLELAGELLVSGFSGVITSYVCYSLGWDFYLIAAATGIAGHMGGRAIYMLENLISRKLGV